MFCEFSDDESEETADEAISHRSVNVEQKSRNLSQRERHVSRPGKDGAVEKLDSGNHRQQHDGLVSTLENFFFLAWMEHTSLFSEEFFSMLQAPIVLMLQNTLPDETL